jgi:glycosyltransferase involved in cell wall biosynthesis
LEIISSGVNGILVTPRDPMELAAAIASIRDDRDRLARAARERMQDFDIRKIVPLIEKFYRTL